MIEVENFVNMCSESDWPSTVQKLKPSKSQSHYDFSIIMFRSNRLSENMIFRTWESEEEVFLKAVKTNSTFKTLLQKKKSKSSRLVWNPSRRPSENLDKKMYPSSVSDSTKLCQDNLFNWYPKNLFSRNISVLKTRRGRRRSD